jgi:hypothetical protein
MRSESRLIALLLLWCSILSFAAFTARAAEQPSQVAQGSLSVVNAITGDQNLFVSFDGQSIWPPGFTPGQSTAAVIFPSGKKELKVECEGYAATEAKLDLPVGANCALIFYPGEKIAEGPDKGKRKIGVFIPAPHARGSKPPQGIHWKVVLVGTQQTAEIEINGQKVSLAPRKSLAVAPAAGGAISVKHKGKELLGSAPEEAGEYWVVIFPETEALAAVLLNHTPFEVPAS